MEAENCPRCERRRHRRLKPGRVIDLVLVLVLLGDIWVTWGHLPAAVSGACPPAEQPGRAE